MARSHLKKTWQRFSQGRRSAACGGSHGACLRLLLLILCLALLPASALAEAGECWSRPLAPYWHRDENCRFADSLRQYVPGYADASPLARRRSVAEAELEGQKPCPGCATAFSPSFTGDFPEWTSALAPWGVDKGDMIDDGGWPRGEAELPYEILSAWGMPVEKLRARFPEGEDPETGAIVTTYPDDYAGVFMNACGWYTFLLVEPTAERVQAWRTLLEGEFWVISARYSMNELNALQRWVEAQIMQTDVLRRQGGDDAWYHIVSVGVDEIGNAVEIGVLTEAFDEGVSRIRGALSGAGYGDPRMVSFVPANYPTWEDF